MTAADFERLREIDRSYTETTSSLKTEKVRGAADAFSANMNRALGAPLLLNSLYHAAGLLLRHSQRPHRRRSADLYQHFRADDRSQYEQVEQYILDQSLIADQAQIRSSLTSVMPSLIADAWTAFESLVRDLWIAAYDSLPPRFRLLDGSETRIASGSYVKMPNKRPAAKPSTLVGRSRRPAVPGMTGTDVETLFKGFPGFASITRMRKSYGLLFSEVHRIKATDQIDSVLSDHTLEFVSLLRHCIVHRGGMVDSIHDGKAKKIPGAPAYPIGHTLPLEGWNTKIFVNHIVSQAANLMAGVDRWVQTARNR
jgi:hypothetical protein